MAHHIIRPLFFIIIAYILFAFIASTIPWIRQKEVGGFEQTAFTGPADFYGAGTGPDRVYLVEEAADAYNVRIRMLREAAVSLDITYHTFDSSECAEALLGETLAAADRGVRIRLLLDGKAGAAGRTCQIIKALAAHENITICLYNPLHLLRPWEWHAILHDKFIIADETYALLGGRNIGERYFAPAGYQEEIANDRDVFVWNTANNDSGGIAQIKTYMDLLWNSEDVVPLAAKVNPELCTGLLKTAESFEAANTVLYKKVLEDYKDDSLPTGKVTLIFNPIHTGPKEPHIGYILKELALTADYSVLLQTPYATANRQLLEAMKQVSSASHLTVMTNSVASSPNYPAFSNYYCNRKKFLATGADLWEYQSRHSIHGKSVVIDKQLSVVGALNMDDRSLYIDTETMLVIDSPEFAQVLTSAIMEYQNEALMVGEDNRYIPSDTIAEVPAPPKKKAAMLIVSVFSRLFQFLI